jgi:hypothetical protein
MTAHPFLASALLTFAWTSVTRAEALVELSGQAMMHSNGKPASSVMVTGNNGESVVTDKDGRFKDLRASVSGEGWIEISASLPDHAAVNALELRRPWPSPLGRGFQVVLAPEAEARDRSAAYWSTQLVKRARQPANPSSKSVASGSVADFPGAKTLRNYGEWLAAVQPEEADAAWLRALHLGLAGKRKEALKELDAAPEQDAAGKPSRRHLQAILCLMEGDLAAAKEHLSAAASAPQADAMAAILLARVLDESGESERARQVAVELAGRAGVPVLLRARAVVSMGYHAVEKGDMASVPNLLKEADDLFKQGAAEGALAYADEDRWASLQTNQIVAAVVIDNDPAKARLLAGEMMRLQRRLLARFPDLHDDSFSDALDSVASMHTKLGDFSEAEALFLERAEFHQERAKTQPAKHSQRQAEVLAQLAELAGLRDDSSAALGYISEAVEIVSGLSQPREAEGHLPLMCRLLREQSSLLCANGQHAEGKRAIQQAVALHATLERISPEQVEHRIGHAISQQGLGNICMTLGETFAAAQAYLAAAQLNDWLAAQGEEEHRLRAFTCLKNVSALNQRANQMKESKTHALAALRYADRIEADHPDGHADLAELSFIVALWLIKEDQKTDGKKHLDRALRLYRKLTEKDARSHGIRLGIALCAEADLLEKAEAGQRLTEADALLRKFPDDSQAPLLREALRQARSERGEVEL